MIRVLIVEDQTIIRQGLRRLLEAQPDLQIVGEAENGQQAIEQVAHYGWLNRHTNHLRSLSSSESFNSNDL
jgi:DNA-binding LytR/AlgR family response regulator